MNVYFACSITGGRQDEPVYLAIVAALLGGGHEVPTAHLAGSGVIELEQIVEAGDVYRRDRQWIETSDALIAEVSTPSHGVGYEIGLALHLGKPVLCLHRHGVAVSKMILGNDDPNLTVQAYAAPQEAGRLAEAFLSRAAGRHPVITSCE